MRLALVFPLVLVAGCSQLPDGVTAMFRPQPTIADMMAQNSPPPSAPIPGGVPTPTFAGPPAVQSAGSPEVAYVQAHIVSAAPALPQSPIPTEDVIGEIGSYCKSVNPPAPLKVDPILAANGSAEAAMEPYNGQGAMGGYGNAEAQAITAGAAVQEQQAIAQQNYQAIVGESNCELQWTGIVSQQISRGQKPLIPSPHI